MEENIDCKYFVITDPDIELNNVNGDILEYYILLLNKFNCDSVGPQLKIDDIPDYYPYKNIVLNKYKKYNLFDKNSKFTKIINYKDKEYFITQSKIDTTFQLISVNNIPIKFPTKKSIRTWAPYDAKHLDWYIDPNNMTDCQKYYTKKTTNISHWNINIKY